MTYISTPSDERLSSRRLELRHRRRQRFLEATWRTILLSGFAGGLIWGATQPIWVLTRPDQIEVIGNKMLSDQAVRGLLPLTYPQSLLRLQPQQLARDLEAVSSIQSATVTRRLLPPGLTVTIQERRPVAVAIQGNETGFVDARGGWIPASAYPATGEMPPPRLRVIGLNDHLRLLWPDLYSQIQRSPVQVSEIDWRDEHNLILKTELGTVHCGAYGPDFGAQITTLDRMRGLSARVAADTLDYIDLRNPRAPAIALQPKGKQAETADAEANPTDPADNTTNGTGTDMASPDSH